MLREQELEHRDFIIKCWDSIIAFMCAEYEMLCGNTSQRRTIGMLSLDLMNHDELFFVRNTESFSQMQALSAEIDAMALRIAWRRLLPITRAAIDDN